jgi:hypothetical protein
VFVRAFCFGPLRQRFAPALGLHFQVADAGLQFQQFHLRVAELLAARTILLDPLQPQALLQDLDFQVGPVELTLELGDLRGVGSGSGGGGGFGAHHG